MGDAGLNAVQRRIPGAGVAQDQSPGRYWLNQGVSGHDWISATHSVARDADNCGPAVAGRAGRGSRRKGRRSGSSGRAACWIAWGSATLSAKSSARAAGPKTHTARKWSAWKLVSWLRRATSTRSGAVRKATRRIVSGPSRGTTTGRVNSTSSNAGLPPQPATRKRVPRLPRQGLGRLGHRLQPHDGGKQGRSLIDVIGSGTDRCRAPDRLRRSVPPPGPAAESARGIAAGEARADRTAGLAARRNVP